MLQNDDADLTLNYISFCEGPVSHSERLLEAHKIASPRPPNNKEVDAVLVSAQQRCFATCANKVGEHYDEEMRLRT